MSFVHEDPEFEQLLHIIARDTKIAAALIEKDYWVTHTLWALHEIGLEIWFKGGTSLSKGFRLIKRFSEDLDLMIERGSAEALPEVSSWTSTNRGPVKKRRAFYDALATVMTVPDLRIEPDASRVDRHCRTAEYLGRYPGVLMDRLAPAMSPFVRLEVGRARVVPYVERALSSFVHDHLSNRSLLGGYADNRPRVVRCAHPLLTLFEKLDAMARRYGRDAMDPDTFVRHYEDAAQIIGAVDTLPKIAPAPLARDMLAQKDIAQLPGPDEPALWLASREKRKAVERAHAKIAPMFWGPRITLDDACATIRAWLGDLRWNE